MSHIQHLINELCPRGVSFPELGDVARIKNGRDYKHLSPGTIPVYGSGGIMTHVDKASFDGPSVLLPRKGSISNVFYVDEPFWNVDTIYYTKINDQLVIPKFFYYVLANAHIEKLNTSNAARPALTQAVLNKVRIPVPPLEVQREIVRILDGFTKLEAELEAELEARRKQYAFYRDQLLTFTPERGRTKWLPLHSIATRIVTGATPKAGNPRFYDDGDIPWIRTQEVNYSRITAAKAFITKEALEETSVKMVHAPAVVVAISGATAGRVATLEIDATTNQHCCNIELDTQRVDHRFVYYWLVSQHDLLIGKKQGVRGDLNLSMIKSLLIPVPPLEEQRRIVAILDKFDALVNDISSGLPAEIEARRKQYEHYRDRLLTFPELNG
ncbi:restriction endonuclease subunit S [Trueperella pyogenes]|uniref:restriction endonuclease subunit S n=1 Tax=Trueperella pyogenes TaxID=1661 RepID=UPI00345D75CB